MVSLVGPKMGGQVFQYRTSKSAVNMAVALMAAALKPKGITVVAMCPGWVKTDMGGAEAPLTPETSIRMQRKVIDSLTLDDTGSCRGHDGRKIAW